MEFKEYLLSQSQVHLSEIAFRMWPNNKTANNYLSKKLHGKMGFTFTEKDDKLARQALKELGIKLMDNSNKILLDPENDLTAKKK